MMLRKMLVALAVGAVALWPTAVSAAPAYLYNYSTDGNYCYWGIRPWQSPFNHPIAEIDNLGYGAGGCTVAGATVEVLVQFNAWPYAVSTGERWPYDGLAAVGPYGAQVTGGCVRTHFPNGYWSAWNCTAP